MNLRQAKKICRSRGWAGGPHLEAWRNFRPVKPNDYYAESVVIRHLRRDLKAFLGPLTYGPVQRYGFYEVMP